MDYLRDLDLQGYVGLLTLVGVVGIVEQALVVTLGAPPFEQLLYGCFGLLGSCMATLAKLRADSRPADIVVREANRILAEYLAETRDA